MTRIAQEAGVSQQAVSLWLRLGPGAGMGPEKASVVVKRIHELAKVFGINDSLAEQQRENQRAKGSSLTQNLP